MRAFERDDPTSTQTPINKSARRCTTPGRMTRPLKLGLSLVLGACCLVLLLPAARADNSYQIDWWTVDGGGGTGTGATFSLSGTVGQPDAGRSRGGNFTLSGGFWSLFAALQTTGAPYLRVALTPTNTVCVWWTLSGTSWQLQATTDLVGTGSSWSVYPYMTNGENCIYIESLPTSSKFYRLHKP
jgi:hypothetical protein